MAGLLGFVLGASPSPHHPMCGHPPTFTNKDSYYAEQVQGWVQTEIKPHSNDVVSDPDRFRIHKKGLFNVSCHAEITNYLANSGDTVQFGWGQFVARSRIQYTYGDDITINREVPELDMGQYDGVTNSPVPIDNYMFANGSPSTHILKPAGFHDRYLSPTGANASVDLEMAVDLDDSCTWWQNYRGRTMPLSEYFYMREFTAPLAFYERKAANWVSPAFAVRLFFEARYVFDPPRPGQGRPDLPADWEERSFWQTIDLDRDEWPMKNTLISNTVHECEMLVAVPCCRPSGADPQSIFKYPSRSAHSDESLDEYVAKKRVPWNRRQLDRRED